MSLDDRNKPCVICGSSNFGWGEPSSDGGVWFMPTLEEANAVGGIKWGKYGLIARLCKSCGNMQIFLKNYPEPEKKKNDQL